jgi:hypothetical protein
MASRLPLAILVTAALAGCTAGSVERSAETGWRAGAASRSVLPTVDGTHAYADASRLPLDTDAHDPGVFVAAFDQGDIHVGNGRDGAHWVRDDLRVQALALERQGGDPIVVLVATDLYMVFAPDADELRRRVRDALPAEIGPRVEVLVSATHNHHGPDTAFHVNPDWYTYFLDQATDVVREAVQRLEPASLRAAEGTHYFGASDLNGIRVYDPTLGVLQARAPDGRVIATLVQWANHPESTLNWSPPRTRIAEACAALEWTGDACDARGRYLTADYPGVLARWLGRRVGGEVLYVNGAIGAMASPLGVPAWEVTDRAPVGNGYTSPQGAQPPGGDGTAFDVRNFRKAVLIGEQLGVAVEALLGRAEGLGHSRLEVAHEPFFTRMSNIGFRKLAVINSATGRPAIGYMPGRLYTCPPAGPKNDTTCTADGYAGEDDPVVGRIRVGDHTRTSVSLVRIDAVTLLFMPGEVPGELVIGLPADVRQHPERWQDPEPARYAPVATFEIPGYLKRQLPGTYRWAVGLGNDELGYILPIVDYRVKCVADQLAGPGTCARLHAAGTIDFPDAVSGARCKMLADAPSPEDAAGQTPVPAPLDPVAASCRYGQALGQAQGHYEETNSVGWDAAQDMFDAVTRLTGTRDTTQVNESFAGYWHGFPKQ